MPVDPDARKRLQDAQRAEAESLKGVELATRARDRVQRKLDQANASLIAAELALVQVSGLERAAVLLAMEVPALRRRVRPGPSAPGESQ